jgi:four helix bundle protein
MTHNIYPIHERIYQYILQVLIFTRKVTKTYENSVIIGQLIRAITSIGANDQEADGTSTKADFIHCYTVARKELKESIFWIRLLGDINIRMKNEAQLQISEGEEIVRIISSIITKSRKMN